MTNEIFYGILYINNFTILNHLSMKKTLKQVSRLALLTLLFTGSDLPSTIVRSSAMEITDETTHEQVYSNKDSAESVASELEKEIIAEQPGDEASGVDPTLEDDKDGDEAEDELFGGTEKILNEMDADIKSDDNAPAVEVKKDEAGDIVEESDTPDGRHIRKEIH